MARIALHLTDRCQLDCDHCLRDPAQRPVDLALDALDEILADSRRLGIARFSLTGGEPTLHPQFPEVLDRIAAHGARWDMISNGRRFSRVAEWIDAVPARRAALVSVGFSLDGATDATHDAIRGVGQRREVLAAMAICVAEGISFSTTTALHARNVHEIEAIAREATELGATSVRFAITQPTGTHLDPSFRLEPSQWMDAERRIRALVPTHPVRLASGWPGESGGSCAPLRGETIHIDAHARLTLCCSHSGIPGDTDGRTIVGSVRGGLEQQVLRLAAVRGEVGAALQQERAHTPGAWAAFDCNNCLRIHGRPHWIDEGPAGAPAARERWHGAWNREKRFLPLTR